MIKTTELPKASSLPVSLHFHTGIVALLCSANAEPDQCKPDLFHKNLKFAPLIVCEVVLKQQV